jgi:hypothetical protein
MLVQEFSLLYRRILEAFIGVWLKFTDGHVSIGFIMTSDVINQKSVNGPKWVNVIKEIPLTQL